MAEYSCLIVEDSPMMRQLLVFALARVRNLRVTDADQSRAMLLRALENESCVAREIVVLNAGAALYACDIAASIGEGIERARAAVASGAARHKLDEFVAATQEAARC